MGYVIIGASYHDEELSVFSQGLDHQKITNREQALSDATKLLVSELRSSQVKDMVKLAEEIESMPLKSNDDLNNLDNDTDETCMVTWFNENDVRIDVQSKKGDYQLQMVIKKLGQ